jgi:hypothetical protein
MLRSNSWGTYNIPPAAELAQMMTSGGKVTLINSYNRNIIECIIVSMRYNRDEQCFSVIAIPFSSPCDERDTWAVEEYLFSASQMAEERVAVTVASVIKQEARDVYRIFRDRI